MITIATDNAAFDDGNRPYEIASILRDLADKVEANQHCIITLRDINGNSIGQYNDHSEVIK